MANQKENRVHVFSDEEIGKTWTMFRDEFYWEDYRWIAESRDSNPLSKMWSKRIGETKSIDNTRSIGETKSIGGTLQQG